MKLFDSDYFTYKENKLFCENLSIEEITKNVSTPVYIYSKNYMTDRYMELADAFESIKHKIYYACKANYNINIIKLFNDLGAGIDVNSAGEFYRAIRAGVDPKNLIFSGVGKTKEEIKLALENNLFIIKAESFEEIELINKIAGDLNKVAPIAIRVNPNVDPLTHPYISTGLAENKFGVDETVAEEIFIKSSKLENIKLLGIDMHIGSQITTKEPYIEAIKKLVELVQSLRNNGINLSHIDIGGGMGVKYYDETPFTAEEFSSAVIQILAEAKCDILLEPGRWLTANAGCLVGEVLFVKNNLDKNFLVIDAAMNDLLRPSIYKAYHHIQPIDISPRETIIADIVGPICESGDFLGKNREILKSSPGDLLAVMSSGAYGIVMSSNYNARRRSAEVLVDGNNYKVIRKRETFDQLSQNEELI
ncbi:MAG: diaminopimelate decarboxylase [Melioribacteraceae bacterium]|nr:diaminopimelate decarboxylase [Melioribacteraceae bacterium]